MRAVTVQLVVFLLGCTPLKADLDPVQPDAAVNPIQDAPADVSPRVDVPPAPDAPRAPDDAAPDVSSTVVAACDPTQRAIELGAVVRGSTLNPGWNANLSTWFARTAMCSTDTPSDVQQHSGPYQVYSLPMPAGSRWRVTLTPDAGIQVNLAAVWSDAVTYTDCPATQRGVTACSAALRGTNPVRTVPFNNGGTNMRMTILVNTPVGGVRGGFTLQVTSTI